MTTVTILLRAADGAVSTLNVPLPTVNPGGTITHGMQLTRALCLPRTSLTTVSGSVNASSFGPNISGKHFKGRVTFDIASTFTDCQFDLEVNTDYGGNKLVTLQNCLVSPTSVMDWSGGPTHVNATRCVFEGSSDGIRFENSNYTECWIRTKLQSAQDHNDGIQAYQADSGGVILRCNIDCRPGPGFNDNSTTTGAIFLADGSLGTAVIRDNYLQGGGYTLRLHESMHYRVTGNIIAKGTYAYGPVSTDNAVPGAFLEWANNTISDGTLIPLPT